MIDPLTVNTHLGQTPFPTSEATLELAKRLWDTDLQRVFSETRCIV